MEVRFDGGVEYVGFNFFYEDGKVMFNGVDVVFGGIKVGRYGRDEFGVCSVEEFFEDGEGFGVVMLEF